MKKNEDTMQWIRRATGMIVILVADSNPNGDPDRESDPRQRSHDGRGVISAVSFKRKLRDLLLMKDGPVWDRVSKELGIGGDGDRFCILEDRNLKRSDIAELLKGDFGRFKDRFWDARVFGNTFLEEGLDGHIRTGVVHFGTGLSVAPVRVERFSQTKKAPTQEGMSRGMAPLCHRVVEHGVYTMPFFVNPTGATGRHGTGCDMTDIRLLLRIIQYAYAHTRSAIRPFVEIRHAWYAEHADGLGSFGEFDFTERLTPVRKGSGPSVSGVAMDEQYFFPANEAVEGILKGEKLYDLCREMPPWCR